MMVVVVVVRMRSTGCKTAIKRELVRLDCKKSIKFCALLPSEGSNCVDHTEATAVGEHMRAGSQVRCWWRRQGSGAGVGWRKKRREEIGSQRAQRHIQRTMPMLCILIRGLNE